MLNDQHRLAFDPRHSKHNEMSLQLQSYVTSSSMTPSTMSSSNAAKQTSRHQNETGGISIPRFVINYPATHQQSLPVQSPNDDVKSAAIALTSLSLSPATGCLHSVGFDEVSPQKRFAFPPHNTPTDETYSPLLLVKPVESCREERVPPPPLICSSSSTCDEVFPSTSVRSRAFSQYSAGEEHKRMLDILPSKPRSYSTSRECFQTYYTPPQYEPLTKQRSYSFDAVGRSHKYYNDEGERLEPRSMLHPQLHYTPSQRKCSVDEGIGTSEGGSSDSLDISPAAVPNKRKIEHKRKGFRCMWRGCDKELGTLSGIILHVRHTHIGVERAGEEEFYFDDIKNNEQQKTETFNQSKSPRLSSSAITIPETFSDSRKIEPNKIKSKPVSVIQPIISAIQPSLSIPFTDNKAYLPGMPTTINQMDAKQKRRKHSIGKKKCRKVYGMSNKDLWCTQCRWKKACARFL